MSDITYCAIDQAAEVIGNRRADEKLQARLRDFLGEDVPDGPFSLDEPTNSAVLAEYIARPTVRDVAFAAEAVEAGFKPWWLTYENDQAGTMNVKKVGMLCPRLALKGCDVSKRWLVPPDQRFGAIGDRPTIFQDLPTVSEYWRALRSIVMPRFGLSEATNNVLDISEWYRRQAPRFAPKNMKKLAEGYYPGVMGLYAARAVLFMNFEPYEQFKPIAAGGFERASEALGVQPVIVKWDSPAKSDALVGERTVRYDQTDLTFLDVKMPPRNQPPILEEITKLVLKELRDDNEA